MTKCGSCSRTCPHTSAATCCCQQRHSEPPSLGGVIGFWPGFVALVLYSVLPILADKLQRANFQPERRDRMANGIQLMALQHGDVDCMATYTGDV